MGSYSNPCSHKAALTGRIFKGFLTNGKKEIVHIHSVFRKVVNLSTDYGILSIVTPEVGMSAVYAMVNEKYCSNFEAHKLYRGMCVRKDMCILDFDGIMNIDFSRAAIWNDTIKDYSEFSLKCIPYEALALYKSAMDRYSKSGSAWTRLSNNEKLSDSISSLESKIEIANIIKSIDELIGNGPGLTPTGDDVLLGFISVINSNSEYLKIREDFRNKLTDNLHKTTDISSSILGFALQNIYHQYIQELLYAINAGNNNSIQMHLKNLISIGGTSGSDIATGIYLAMRNI